MLDWDVSKRPSAREVVTIAQRVLFGNNAEATTESTVGSIKVSVTPASCPHVVWWW